MVTFLYRLFAKTSKSRYFWGNFLADFHQILRPLFSLEFSFLGSCLYESIVSLIYLIFFFGYFFLGNSQLLGQISVTLFSLDFSFLGLRIYGILWLIILGSYFFSLVLSFLCHFSVVLFAKHLNIGYFLGKS